MISTTVPAIISVGLNLIFLPKLGFIGAAIVSVLTEALVWGIQLYFTRTYLKEVPIMGSMMKIVFASGLMYGLLLLVKMCIRDSLDDIELHFLHYADEEEATKKWNRRLKRMHWDNLYFKFNDNDACTYELMKEFEELPYKSKVIFSSKNYSDLPSLVHFKSAEKQGYVGIDLKTYHRYFNAVTWLNKGGEDLTK